MSAKKSAQPSWYTCGKCKLKFPNHPSMLRHSETQCSDVYPFIVEDSGALVIEISHLPQGTKLPGSKSTESSDKIYLRDYFMTEGCFKTSEWIMVKPNTNRYMEGQDTYNSPVAFQVWPLNDTGTRSKAALTSNGFKTNCSFVQDTAYHLERFEHNGNFDLASEVVLQIEGTSSDYESGRLISTFKTKFNSRPVTVGNRFMMEFYAGLLRVCISSITPPNNVELNSAHFYRIIDKTNVILEFSIDKKHDGLLEPMINKVTFDDVGGLDSQAKEVIDTIKYMSRKDMSGPKIPRGILIHGHYGTGKSLFIQAICNTLNYEPFVIEEFSKSKGELDSTSVSQEVKEKFDAALRTHSGAAIIIENLDGLAPSVSRSDQKSSFSSILRNQMDRSQLQNSKIVVLASTSNLDQIDPALRSPHIFCKEVELPVPSMPQRQEIIHKLVQKLNHQLDEDAIRDIASSTHGYVGADLQALFTESVLQCDGPVTMSSIFECLKSVRPSALKSILIEIPNVMWTDIGGMEDLKFKLKQSIQWPLSNPKAFTRLGVTPPKGVLLFGPPGCSKTMIAKAIATQSGVNFVSVKGSELFSKWVGESEKAIQKLFQKARQVAPCVLFFDEIDSMGGERGQQGTASVNERVLAQMLIEMDGIEQLKKVTIIAATNRPDLIDQALLRPGRLDRLIYVPLPDDDTRRKIFDIRLKKMPAHDINVDRLVELTDGYSGAEIIAVCQEAGMKALEDDIEATEVKESHFLTALTVVTKRTTPSTVSFYENYVKGI